MSVSSVLSSTALVVLLLFACLPLQIYAIYCHRCLSLHCPSEEANYCEEVRGFIVREIQSYYHINVHLPPCIDIKEKGQWRLLELYGEKCPEGDGETCSAGRIQVKTSSTKTDVVISHAKVLGCAKENLVGLIRRNSEKTKTQLCNLITINGTTTTSSSSLFHEMQMEHCNRVKALCDTDFCVNPLWLEEPDPNQSVVKSFEPPEQPSFEDYGLIIGIIALIVGVLAIIIGVTLYFCPLRRPSNLSLKTSEDPDLIVGPSTYNLPSVLQHSTYV